MSAPVKLPGVNNTIGIEERNKFGMRKGLPVEKGVVISPRELTEKKDLLLPKLRYYTVYPDMFVDEVLVPTDSNFKLLFTQRIFMRAMMRFKAVHITAARGFSKTFISVLALVLKAIFQPHSEIAITAPTKTQAAQIGRQKMQELLTRFPLLKNELIGEGNFGKDYAKLTFRNTSYIEITAALETTRGRRYSALMCDELRDTNGDAVNSILLPTLVISRRTMGKNLLNPYEKHQTQIFTTSASSKSSYNYEKLLEIFVNSIVDPNSYAAFGIDYRVPVIEGLIDNAYINDMKLAQTFDEQSFAREFLSIYTGDNEDSWFDFSRMNKHRKIVNADWAPKLNKQHEQFYLLSVDVGRLRDQTVVTVFKVTAGMKENRFSNYRENPTHAEKNNHKTSFRSKVVNIFVLGRTPESKTFSRQALDLKKLIEVYKPKEVVIDTNGLGIAIAEEIIKPHWDENGKYYEPYGFNNNDDYKKIQPADAPTICYSIKATSSLNSQMYSNCYSRINSGLVDFLIKEQDARGRLLATKKGQKLSVEKKVKRLMPYEMTTKLFEEMGNLRLKRLGAGADIHLEQINTRYPKDKFSSLIMGLWRIKELEDTLAKKQRRRGIGKRKLVFFD